MGDGPGAARYVFRVRFRLEPTTAGVSVEPAAFDTTLHRRADPPGEPGWLFFRDHCWRGELTDPAHFREVTEAALEVPVESVAFRELQATDAYLAALRDAIGSDLEPFRARSVDEVLSKYLGSSIRVVEALDPASPDD